MRWLLKAIAGVLAVSMLLLAAGAVVVSRKAIAPFPAEPSIPVDPAAPWFPKEKYGVNHIFLEGNPFERGFRFGHATRLLLEKQEDALMEKFREVFPGTLLQKAFVLLAKSWFYDVDSYIHQEWRREMHGVSLSAPAKYDSLADSYTRQLAYHGLHEAGQAFVDYGEDGFGCTVLAVPQPGKSGWLLGRNFDFEGGRIFDEEKILKWVYPERGIPFVSVIWAGMVGAVTGVNREGVYISLNAAGSKDFSRLGTPTSLVLLEALQTSATAEAAVELIRRSPTVITEIFVVAGPNSPLYVVEKSPERVYVHEHKQAVAVANHLLDPAWKGDSINDYRRDELTSAARLARGTEIVKELAGWETVSVYDIAAGLRDKIAGGKAQPGHRSAIDAQIATHVVVYDTLRGHLYVSEGPSLSGAFRGFDVAASLSRRAPVEVGRIPEDKKIPPAAYARVRADVQGYSRFLNRREAVDCAKLPVFGSTPHYLREFALAKAAESCGRAEEAAVHWRAGLALSPAYARERKLAESRLR